MSLSLALGNALSGLRVAQASLASVSHNIANANNPEHSREIVNQSALVLDNVGSGVQIDNITRKVDQFIARSIRGELANTGQAEAISEYMRRLQLSLGEPDATAENGNSLNAHTDNFFNALQDLAQNPERASLKQNALRAATTLTNHMNAVARAIEDLRFEADQDISRAIVTINTSIDELHRINKAINIASSKGQTTATLLDKRDTELRKISELVDTNTTFKEDGQVYLTTAGGLSLLTDQRSVLDYIPAPSIDTFINNTALGEITVTAIDASGIRSSFSEVLVGAGQEGSLNTNLKSGKLKGLLEVRDIEFPKVLETLDQFSSVLIESFNAIHNTGSGLPPATQLTGTLLTDPTEVREWTGRFTVAALDSNGAPLTNPYNTTPPTNVEVGGMRPLNLSLNFDSGENGTGRHSLQTVIDEINAFHGAQQTKVHINNLNDIRLVARDENNPVGATLNFDFSMENVTSDVAQVEILNVTPSAGVVSVAPPAAAVAIQPGQYGRTGTDMSFQVNGYAPGATVNLDIRVRVTNPVDLTSQEVSIRYTVDTSITDIKNNRFIGTQSPVPPEAAPVTVGTPPVTVIEEPPILPNQQLIAEMVNSNGTVVPAGTDGYLRIRAINPDARVVLDDSSSSDLGQTFTVGGAAPTNRGFGHYFGMNNFFVDSYSTTNNALDMQVRADIQQNSGLLSTSALNQSAQPANAVDGPLYTSELGYGNSQVVQVLADLALNNVDFAAAGVLPNTSQTLSSYAGSFLGAVSSNSNYADLEFENNTFILQGFEETDLSIRGVNVDEELANTIVYQNAYTAATRVINVVDELMEALLAAV